MLKPSVVLFLMLFAFGNVVHADACRDYFQSNVVSLTHFREQRLLAKVPAYLLNLGFKNFSPLEQQMLLKMEDVRTFFFNGDDNFAGLMTPKVKRVNSSVIANTVYDGVKIQFHMTLYDVSNAFSPKLFVIGLSPNSFASKARRIELSVLDLVNAHSSGENAITITSTELTIRTKVLATKRHEVDYTQTWIFRKDASGNLSEIETLFESEKTTHRVYLNWD